MFGRLLLAVFLLVSGPAWKANAAENLNQTEKLAFGNWHDEMIECYVYNLIGTQLLRNEPNPDKEVIEKYEQVNITLLKQAKVLRLAIGMMDEAAAALMNLVYRNMFQEINNDIVNFSILVEKYTDLCKVVYENSDSRIRYWMNEATKEP